MKFNYQLVFCAFIALSMLVAGCGGDEAPNDETSSSASDRGTRRNGGLTENGGETAASDDGPAFPEFPFPEVPQASARDTIEMSLLTADIESATFGEISHRLETAIGKVGYPKIGYYTVPNGFALTTYLEQIDDQGVPREPRFLRDVVPRQTSSFFDFIRSLFTADPGYWRVIVFLVTDQPFHESGSPPTEEEAHSWPSHGAPSLSSLEDEPINANHECTVLIYEFQKRDRNSDPEPASLGLSVVKHLQNAQIMDTNGILRGVE